MKDILNNKYVFTIILVLIAAVIFYFLTKGKKNGGSKFTMPQSMAPISSTPNAMVESAWCENTLIKDFDNPNLYASCLNAIGICEQEAFLEEWKQHLLDPAAYTIGSSGCNVEAINYEYE